MTEPIHIIEQITRVTPLGLRFWDKVSGAIIGDGLVVTAYPHGNPVGRVKACTNCVGIYVFRDLTGLRDIEYGTGDADYWETLPLKQPFVIAVEDRERRFHPFSFNVDIPFRGLFTWECDAVPSPPSQKESYIPLYSTLTRAVPGGMAVLRADLKDTETDAPAAWAVIEVRMANWPPVQGIADEKGRVALIFPYPEPVGTIFGSPSATPGLPLTQQEWPIQLQAKYKNKKDPVPPIPDLCDTLMQPSAILWADSAKTQPLTMVKLKFSQELIVRTYDSGNGKKLPHLLITPAVSPP